MTELIAHAFGDYVFQSDWMAQKKTSQWFAASVHALAYSAPFLFLCSPSPVSWAIIVGTHAVIDRLRVAKYIVFAKNFLAPPSAWPKWSDCTATGYPSATPQWMAVWLLIIADNALHLLINHFALAVQP